MFLIDKLKGVWNKMISPKTLENVLHITPTISNKMKESIELWEKMYTNESPWLNENVKSLGLAASIASEKARTATIEMEIKVTGEGKRAKFIKEKVKDLIPQVRKNLEYGIALGSLIIKPYVVKSAEDKYDIKFNFTKATNFYPLSFSAEGELLEVAFLDKIVTKDYIYTKLEYHKLEGSNLIIQNMAFKSKVIAGQTNPINMLSSELGTPIPLTDVPAWAALEPEANIKNANGMLFAYFKMPQANCIDINSPLGVSGFSRAVGLIKDADEQYSNLLWEFEGGQLAIDVDRTALIPMRDAKGKEIPGVLPKLQDRLYRRSLDLNDDNSYNVFSPQLRDESIINGLNNILMRIEDVCDLSRGTLSQITYTDARTATELRILKQRSYSANCDIQKELELALENVIKIIDKYCDLYAIQPSGNYEVAYSWDDSIIVDKDAERQVDLLDVNNGLLSKVEYRMKWMGETRKQAEDALKQIGDEKREAINIQQQVNTIPTEAQQTSDKLNRANESDETTKINEK